MGLMKIWFGIATVFLIVVYPFAWAAAEQNLGYPIALYVGIINALIIIPIVWAFFNLKD